MSYRIKPLGKGAVNLLTLQSIGKYNLFAKLINTITSTILTTVEFDTHLKYQQQLNHIKTNNHIRFVPYYTPLIYIHNNESNLSFSDAQSLRKISLLIGDNNESLINQLNLNKIVTVEEVCQVYPEKVPLSYRKKDKNQMRSKLQQRLGIKTIGDRVFQFEHMFLINPNVRMWDEAYQIILDCLPTPLYVPYLKQLSSQGQIYYLTGDDFLNGLTKIHQTVSTAVKTHPPLTIIRFDQKKQLSWLISHVADEADRMSIDPYFFTHQPQVKQLDDSDRLSIVQKLQSVL